MSVSSDDQGQKRWGMSVQAPLTLFWHGLGPPPGFAQRSLLSSFEDQPKPFIRRTPQRAAGHGAQSPAGSRVDTGGLPLPKLPFPGAMLTAWMLVGRTGQQAGAGGGLPQQASQLPVWPQLTHPDPAVSRHRDASGGYRPQRLSHSLSEHKDR